MKFDFEILTISCIMNVFSVVLQGSELAGALSAEEQSKLKQTFKRLDTDMDG